MASRKDIEQILTDQDQLNKLVFVAMKTIDTNDSGTLDPDELGNIMRQVAIDVGDTPPSDSDIREVFAELDKNNDGYIDFDEFKDLIVRVLNNILSSELA
ncbi:unnamed protein product [Blepharisma stoltei]|uniref:EF-hand domain-containing protein n=1 Tax=Blepharisma stoltei TaxID=1481888 RepID=A0AAU9JXT9_9CILI|nr:unnamed protein product [Blepharisma stoltei]